MSAAAAATTRRIHRAASHRRATCSVTRNQKPADAALQIAAKRFTRAATFGAIGSNENTRPTITKNGLPGGCGSPKVYAAAMYSLVSHMAVDGAMVRTYSANTMIDAIAATPYEGESSAD